MMFFYLRLLMFVFLVTPNGSLFQILTQFPFEPGLISCIQNIILSSLIEEVLPWMVFFFFFETLSSQLHLVTLLVLEETKSSSGLPVLSVPLKSLTHLLFVLKSPSLFMSPSCRCYSIPCCPSLRLLLYWPVFQCHKSFFSSSQFSFILTTLDKIRFSADFQLHSCCSQYVIIVLHPQLRKRKGSPK